MISPSPYAMGCPPTYITDPESARAFVSGILESGASYELALRTIERHCAEYGYTPDFLLGALADLCPAVPAGAPLPNRYHAYTHDADGTLIRLG